MRILQSENPRPLDLLAVGPDGLVAASCSTIGVGGDVEVWALTTGAVRHRSWVSDRECRGLAFTPDGRHLLAGEPRAILRIDLSTDGPDSVKPGPNLELGYPEFSLSADGRRLLIAEAFGSAGFMAMVEVYGEGFRHPWEQGPDGSEWYKLPALSHDADRFAVARRGSLNGAELVQIRDAADGKILTSIPSDPADPAKQLAFTADGAKLLVRRDGRTIDVFDAATGTRAGKFVPTGRPNVTGMAVRPGGGEVAVCRTDGTVWFWDPATLQTLKTFDWKAGRLVSVAFSPDGSVAAAGTERGEVVVWDLE